MGWGLYVREMTSNSLMTAVTYLLTQSQHAPVESSTCQLVAHLVPIHTRFRSFAPVVMEPPPCSGRPRAYEGAWRCLGYSLLEMTLNSLMTAVTHLPTQKSTSSQLS